MFNRLYALCLIIALCGCGDATVVSGTTSDVDTDNVDNVSNVSVAGLEVQSNGVVIGTAIGAGGALLNKVVVLSKDGYMFELNTATGEVLEEHYQGEACSDGTEVATYAKVSDTCQPLSAPLLRRQQTIYGENGVLIGEYKIECDVINGEGNVIENLCKLSVEEVDLPLSYDLPIDLVP